MNIRAKLPSADAVSGPAALRVGIIGASALAVLLFVGRLVLAQSPSAAEEPSSAARPANLAFPTLGGKQFWADELVFRGYRIQRHAITGHYRLLDEKNVRQAWGRFDECRAALDEIKRRDKLPPLDGKVVLVLHGLGRSREGTSGMAKFLEAKGDFTALTVGYPSALAEVEGHAASLGRVIENLEGVEEIHFVAHSLGNLVIRRWLHEQMTRNENGKIDARVKRIVMLGAPNNGAKLAETIARNKQAIKLIGLPGKEIGAGWAELSKKLATPPGEFGTIAGGKGDGEGFNPWLPGDDAVSVTVAETRLTGARDFLRLPVLHTFMMDDAAVQAATLRFLQEGWFVSAEKREGIDKNDDR